MAERFAIREISRFFHIPESTLRYWEDKKILNPGKAENGYRMYSVEDLMTISDIVFYKNLGLSLSEIGGMEQTSAGEHRKLFAERMEEIERQRALLERQMAKLTRHMQALDTLEELQKHPFQEADPGAVCMVSFELVEKEKLLQYIEDPYLYSRVQHSRNPKEEHRGLAITKENLDAFSEDILSGPSVLWRRSPRAFPTTSSLFLSMFRKPIRQVTSSAASSSAPQKERTPMTTIRRSSRFSEEVSGTALLDRRCHRSRCPEKESILSEKNVMIRQEVFRNDG